MKTNFTIWSSWFSDSSSTNNHLHYLSVYNGNVNIFSQYVTQDKLMLLHDFQRRLSFFFSPFFVSLFLSLSLLSLSIYISSSCIIFSGSVLRYIVIHRVGDNGRTVNTSMSPHISDQFDQVFLYSMVFNVNIWTGMVSNNTISWSATYNSTVQYQNTDLFPPWTRLCIADSSAFLDEQCPYFCLNPTVVHPKTCVLMYL